MRFRLAIFCLDQSKISRVRHRASLCISQTLCEIILRVSAGVFEPERDYPRCISQNPSVIIISVQIHDVLRAVISTFLRGHFSSSTRASTTPPIALSLHLHTRSSTSSKAFFTPSSYALFYVFECFFTSSAGRYFQRHQKRFLW